MERKRISLSDLIVGEPLPWDAYSSEGVLLLKRGQTVPSEQALQRLIDEGLFLQGDDAGRRVDTASAQEKPTAMQHLVNARRSLSYLYDHGPEQSGEFPARLERVIEALDAACTTHAPLCISSILLMQDDLGYKVKHAIDSAVLANLLARELGLDESTRHATVAAALTMNIGMCEFQERLDAISGKLNDKLLAMIRQHPAHSAERLAKLGVSDEQWLAFVRQHHENRDGTGYPAGVGDSGLSVGARIVGIADRYCAMVSNRGYHGPHKPNLALRELYVKEGQKIDTGIVAALIRIVGLYPIGTLVRLKSAEIGVVTGPGESPETPAVHAVIAKSGLFLEVASYRKTHRAETAIDEVLTFDKLTTPIRMANLWGKEAKFT